MGIYVRSSYVRKLCRTFFSIPLFYGFIVFYRNEVLVGSNTEGIEKVVESDGGYAYMMESSSIQYIIERNCKVTQIGGNLDNKVCFIIPICKGLIVNVY